MAETTLRLFFALWPDPATRAAIADLAGQVAAESRGRAVASDNVHLTLAFLGAQRASSVPELRALASAIQAAAFQLSLDEIGCFRKAGIAWLGATSVPSEVIALQANLAQSLAGIGIVLEARPFSPHLTLARRVAVALRRRLARPILWSVSSFALVASDLDRERARYKLLDEWHAGRSS